MNWIACAQELVRPLWAKIHPVAINAQIDRTWSEKVTNTAGEDEHRPPPRDDAYQAVSRLLAVHGGQPTDRSGGRPSPVPPCRRRALLRVYG